MPERVQIEAPYVLRRGPVFRVDPRGHGEGPPEMHLDGARAFERRFEVRSMEPITTRALLDAPTRVRLMSLARWGKLGRSRVRPHLSSDGRVVRLHFSGATPSEEIRREAEALVEDLAAYGREALALLTAIPGAVLKEPPDAPPYVVLEDVPVTLYPWAAMGTRPFARLALVAMTPRLTPGPEFRLPISETGQVAPEAAHGHVPDALLDRLKRVGPCILEVAASEVRMTWDIDHARPEAMREGAQFIAALAGGDVRAVHASATRPGCCT